MQKPMPPPSWQNILRERVSDAGFAEAVVGEKIREFVRMANDRYLHWQKLRFQPMPPGVDAETAWAAVGMSRSSQLVQLPLSFFRIGQHLHYWLPPQHHEWISLIDQKAGGYIGTRYRRSIPDDHERYLFNSLMEEAIASSQLEGATTTREVAKEMLRTGRRPHDNAERMILNNYKAILEIRDLKEDKLTPAMLCHLQDVLTEGTLKNPQAAGRFRLAEEEVSVVDVTTDEILYTPPPAATLEKRIEEVCDFANAKSKPFVHPIIKAMALHFALGFIHPFVDGNGRTARAVFYWYMLKNGYWLFEYLPISRIIVGAPAKYARAYLYTETDNGDLGYFNHYHLDVVIRSIKELHEYLEDQQRQLNEADKLLEQFTNLNYRQKALLQDALKHSGHKYTAREHEGKYRVSYNTARTDLIELHQLGLFTERRREKGGKERVYGAAPDLMKRLQKARHQSGGQSTKKGKSARSGASSHAKQRRHPEESSARQRTLFDLELFD